MGGLVALVPSAKSSSSWVPFGSSPMVSSISSLNSSRSSRSSRARRSRARRRSLTQKIITSQGPILRLCGCCAGSCSAWCLALRLAARRCFEFPVDALSASCMEPPPASSSTAAVGACGLACGGVPLFGRSARRVAFVGCGALGHFETAGVTSAARCRGVASAALPPAAVGSDWCGFE